MDDISDLENALFNENIKEKNLPNIEPKKKVMFEDKDEQSDESYTSDDDFPKSPTEKTVPIVKSEKVVDLFKLNSDDIKEQVKNNFLQNDETVASKKSPSPSVRKLIGKSESSKETQKESDLSKSTSFMNANSKNHLKNKSLFDEDDITSNLVENKTRGSNNNLAKKSFLIKDLFGSKSKLSASSESVGIANQSSFKFDVPFTRSSTVESYNGSTEYTSKTTNSSGFSLSASKEPRRGRRLSVVQNDPLGLLATSSFQVDEISKEKKTTLSEISSKTVQADLPEWLGGSKVAKEPEKDSPTDQKLVEISMKSASSLPTVLKPELGENLDRNDLTSKLLGMEFDQQTAILNLQQQEHELRTVAALSQQSEKLNYLLETQKIKLSEQEKQFNVLIARQIDRQASLEAQMKAQQDRIDSYIQSLIAQPTTIPTISPLVSKDVEKELGYQKEESESLVQKLELEKVYLENTLDSLREKHEREISILEDSYKKQITFLEEAMVQMEKRLQDDVDCIEADYKTKISKLKEEIFEIEKTHKAEKNALREENVKIIQEIRNQHYSNVELLQKEHIESIERITKSKESERHALEVMRIDGTNVQNVLNKSQVIVEGLENLQKKFESRDNTFIESQNHHFSVQEKNFEYLKESLKKQKDEFTEEKLKLMSTIKKLESDMSGLIKEFQLQNTSFKESEDIIKSRELSLLRDREIFLEQTNWERERLQALRDSWTKEQEMQLEWLFQERQALATEKAKIQIFNRLGTGGDDSSKVEIEATIKAARDAATNANKERLKWQEKLNELENQQSVLQDKENQLVQKAKELQEFFQSAIEKRDEGLRALKEARFLEERYKEKFYHLQKQEENLTQRESKLASEKLELAKERIAIRVNLTNKPEKDSLVNEKVLSTFIDGSSRSGFTSCNKEIIDPNLVLLRWDLDDKLQVSEKVPLSSSH